ncbi:MAG: alpha/beta hydrolase [Aridibacter sp.]
MKNNNKFKFVGKFLLLFLLTAIPFSAYAQKAGLKNSGRSSDQKLDSKLMKRQMPYRVILPVGYNVSNEKVFYPTIYLLHGLTGHYDNWGDKAELEKYTESYKYIFVMPEGDNGWYSDSAMNENDKYESYIIEELIPEIEKKFRSQKERGGRVIAGLSMGGYGGLKFGIKYPDKFVLAGSFSGALRAAEFDAKVLGGWKVLADSITTTFGEADSDTRKENDVFKLVKEKSPAQIKEMPFIYLDCGTEDGLIKQNMDFANLLLEKRIPHEYRQLPGKHEWAYWNSQIKEFLELSRKFVK